MKTLWANGRVSANAAVFYIDWDDLQLNVPNPAVPAQFYISNVGGAVSKGVELEISARAAPGRRPVHGGRLHARAVRRRAASRAASNVEGNKIPNTPDYTASAGAAVLARPSGRRRIVGRADVVFYGAFQYNDQNSLGQDAYSLVNLRLGVDRAVPDSASCSSATPSTRGTFRSRSRTRASRRRASWARWARRGRSA